MEKKNELGADAAASAAEQVIEEIVTVLKAACDRNWSDETPIQVANIAANAIYWRDHEVKQLRRSPLGNLSDRDIRDLFEIIRYAQRDPMRLSGVLRLLRGSQQKVESSWRPITDPPPDRMVLVTNNIEARTNSGQMSHVWRGYIIEASHPEKTGKYVMFNDGDLLIQGLTHYCEIPQVGTGNQVSNAVASGSVPSAAQK